MTSSLSFLSFPRFRRHSFHPNSAVTGDMGENQMTVDELKAELDMRGVNFDDCISKNELVDRLVATRVSGKANPDILKRYNNMQSDDPDAMSPSVFDDQDIIGKVQAKDGSLPVGNTLISWTWTSSYPPTHSIPPPYIYSSRVDYHQKWLKPLRVTLKSCKC